MTTQEHNNLKAGDKIANIKSGKVYTVSNAYDATTNWGAVQLGRYVLAQPMNVLIKPNQINNWRLV